MDPVTILFACRQNAGRSQIAAALAKKLAPAGVSILSAGTTPATEIHPNVREALAQRGLEPANPTPTLLTPETVKESDWVITMGCGESCPIFPGKHYGDWKIDDPAHMEPSEVEGVIAQIEARIVDLLARI